MDLRTERTRANIKNAFKVMLSTLIYGMFQSYRAYKDVDYDMDISSLVKLNSALKK